MATQTKQVPQHVKIAREKGAKAGYKAYREFLKRSGIPAVQERYQEMLDQGDVPAQYAWYCQEYADQIGKPASATKARTSKPHGRTATPATTAATPDLLAAFAAFMQAQGVGVTDEVEDEEEVDIDAELEDIDDTVPHRGPGRPKGSKNKPKASAPADPYAPKDPAQNATNGRLWKLNELGLLAILDAPTDPITNGEAHEILKANL